MDTKTIFVLTPKGEEEVSHKTSLLYGDIKRALSMIDGVSTFAEISKRAAPSLRTILAELVKELLTGGFIQDKSRVGFSAKIVVPPKAAPAAPISAPPKQEQADSELDFTTIMRAPSAEILRAEAAKVQAEMLAKQQAEQQKLKAEQEAAKAKQLVDAENARKAAEHEARVKAAADAEAKSKQEAEARAKQEAEVRARKEAEEKARKEAEEKARKEAEEKARKEAEEKARKEAEEKARKEAEEKARKEAEEKARKEAEEKARKEAEEKARKEAEEKARKEAEEKARKEAEEKARKEAEEKARKEAEEKARKEAEEKARKEAEEKARKEAEEKARKEAEEKARKEAEEKARKEAEEKARKEAEEKAKLEAESKARAQAEFARLKAEQEAEKVRKEAELAKQKADAEAARFKAEEEAAKSREEAERIKREAELAAAKAKEEAERIKKEAEAAAALAKAEVEAKSREEAERIKKEAEAAAALAKAEAERIKQEADEQAKVLEEATRKAQAEAEAARLKAEEEAARVRAELEAARLKLEQEAIARAEAETARLAAEHIAAQALVLAEQQKLQEMEKLAVQAREEEKIRAKRHALAAASTQIRDTPYDTSKPPSALKLDAINLDALEIKPEHTENHSKADKAKEVVVGLSAEELKAQEAALKAKEEALKQQAKKAEEARLAEEAAGKKLADAQAKAWAEAEQRAAQAAKSHVEHLAQQSAQSAQAKQQQEKNLKATMNKRKPLPWGGIAAALLLLAVAAVFIVPMALNTRNYADNLEAQLSKELGQPVHIGKLSLRILPTPQVVLGEIYIGEIKQIKAQQVQLDMSFGALFGAVKSVDKVEVQGGELNSNGLLSVPDWLEKMAADSSHPIHQIVFSGMKVTAEAVQFNDIDGTVDFASNGKIDSAVLHAMGGKYTLELKAASQGKFAATFNLRKAALPLLPNWNFDDMTAKGELTRDGLKMTEFDSRIAGGVLQGDATIEWKNGWSAVGSLNAKTVSLSSISKLLEGDMDGVGRYKMQADSLANLTDSVSLDGTFAVQKGMFNGVDIVETARLHSKDHLPGGRTHFDQMDGALVYSGNVYRFKSIKVINSVMNATGNVDIAKQQLSGRLSARLSITEGMGPVDLQLGGVTDNPNLRAIR